MFVAHVFTLTAVCVGSAVYAFFNVDTLQDNLQQVQLHDSIVEGLKNPRRHVYVCWMKVCLSRGVSGSAMEVAML